MFVLAIDTVQRVDKTWFTKVIRFNIGRLRTEGIVPYSELVLADKFIS